MEISFQTTQKATISEETVKEIVKTFLLNSLKVHFGNRDFPYIQNENLVKYEDWGSRGDDRIIIRKATDLDKAIVLLLEHLRK